MSLKRIYLLKVIKKRNKNIFKKINFKKSINHAKENFIDILNLPKELSGNYSKITMIENNELLIEGETNVVDYYDNYIKIKFYKRRCEL